MLQVLLDHLVQHGFRSASGHTTDDGGLAFARDGDRSADQRAVVVLRHLLGYKADGLGMVNGASTQVQRSVGRCSTVWPWNPI